VWLLRAKGKIDVLYYPPAGPHRVPFYRDLLTLCLVRSCAGRIVFHFHAGGFDQLPDNLSFFECVLARIVYRRPFAAIVLQPSLAKEVAWIRPQRIFVVPNGVDDQFNVGGLVQPSLPAKIVFLGLLTERKGIMVCLKAASLLRRLGYNFLFSLVGEWESHDAQDRAIELANGLDLEKVVTFEGARTGQAKWELLSTCSIFCLPTFDTEAMPLSIIEAMMMGLPVVSTNWRSIPEIVDNGKTGFLVPINDHEATAEKLGVLLSSPNLSREFGRSGRAKYLNSFTISHHLRLMEDALRTCAFD
jgi:glycosyltransferase involved in cell wall biosynthesis